MKLFHRTSIAEATSIVRNGFEDDKWRFDLRDGDGGQELTMVGVWLTDRPLSGEEGPQGDAVLEVILDFEEADLKSFELEGVFWDARLWVAPAALINPKSKIRILEVDPGTSWWHEAQPREE